MHYAEFADDEVCPPIVARGRCTISVDPAEHRVAVQQKAALLNAMKEYEANRWKFIGQKLGKPAKVRSLEAQEPPFAAATPQVSCNIQESLT